MNGDDKSQPKVYIVDDDAASRMAIKDVMSDLDIDVESFRSAEEFLARFSPGSPGCVLLDISMPGLSGPELQQEMNRRGWQIPIVLVSGEADVPVTVQTMEAGALAVIEKPFDIQELVKRVHQAIELDSHRRFVHKRLSDVKSRYEALTPREREVMKMVATGLLTKEIAYKFGISERTIDVHRRRIMKKMLARTVANLTTMCVELGLVGTTSETD